MQEFIFKLSKTIKAFSPIYLFWQLNKDNQIGSNNHTLNKVVEECSKNDLMVVKESSNRVINRSNKIKGVFVAYRSEQSTSENQSYGPKNYFLKVVSGPLNNHTV